MRFTLVSLMLLLLNINVGQILMKGKDGDYLREEQAIYLAKIVQNNLTI